MVSDPDQTLTEYHVAARRVLDTFCPNGSARSKPLRVGRERSASWAAR
jgi:hypothetical protein